MWTALDKYYRPLMLVQMIAEIGLLGYLVYVERQMYALELAFLNWSQH